MTVFRSTKRFTRGKGALLCLSILFLLSGVLRIWDTAGAAIALDGAAEPAVATSCACEAEPEVAAVLDAIRRREEDVLVKEQRITDRLRALEVAEVTVTAKLEELKTAEEELRSTMAQSQTAAENDLARLTTVYENMKPKDAAALFSQMAPEFAAGFLGRMRADAAAEIMAGLEPATAYAISVLMAGRNADAPVE